MLKRLLEDFEQAFPAMSSVALPRGHTLLCGKFDCIATDDVHGFLHLPYHLTITIPPEYPLAIPIVRETKGGIPRHPDYHVNADGSLCLGAPLLILKHIRADNSLVSFADHIITPHLYAATLKKLGICEGMVFGELAHGDRGLYDEYKELFGVQTDAQVEQILELLRTENLDFKQTLCPCGCGKKLSCCRFRQVIMQWRKITTSCLSEYLTLGQPSQKNYSPCLCEPKLELLLRPR